MKSNKKLQNDEKQIVSKNINYRLLLRMIEEKLNMWFPKMKGTAFQLVHGNSLEADFILQTPNVWGKPSDEVQINAGINVAEQITTLIASAECFIDITTLHPFPDGTFFHAIQQGLKQVSQNGRKITVRILAGWPVFDNGTNQREYLQNLIEPFKSSENISIFVAAQRNTDLTWNHAKIIAVDGKKAIIGGENFWDANYLGPCPVHDLNIKFSGPLVYYLHKFIDIIWGNVNTYKTNSWKSVYWSLATGIQKKCLVNSMIPQPTHVGNITMLGAGRYWSSDSRAADKAISYCFESANDTVYISQMDLRIDFIIHREWQEGVEALVEAITRGVVVKIVISDDFGKASETNPAVSSKGTSYSYSTQDKTFNALVNLLKKQINDGKIIKGRLEVAVLRFGPSPLWPNQWGFANHAKFFMIDEQLFYIGSENLYPSDLIEYGVFIEDSEAVLKVKTDYWEKLWQYSSCTKLVFPNNSD